MDKDKIVKIIFARDYTPDLENIETEITPEERELICKAADAWKYQKTIPPFAVDKQAADEFNKMVVACDEIAKEFSGKLTAIVDYENYDASITMECVYVDFKVGEFMETLYKMATKALLVRFEPTITDFLRISITMPYFLWPYTEK